MTVKVTFLGGLGEIGRNCAALEIDGRICLIDVGLMFPEEDMLGVDLVFPDWSWLEERADDVDFVLITHGHEDHMGALAYFLRDIPVPVYGTPLTLELAKSRVDELGVPDVQFHPVQPREWRKHGPFRFQLIRVSHSVPDATAVAFDTPEGLVVHSGDFKLDPTPIDGLPTDLPAFASLGERGVRPNGRWPSRSATSFATHPGVSSPPVSRRTSTGSSRSSTPVSPPGERWRSSAGRCNATPRWVASPAG